MTHSQWENNRCPVPAAFLARAVAADSNVNAENCNGLSPHPLRIVLNQNHRSVSVRAQQLSLALWFAAWVAQSSFGCSVLSHEALVDALWKVKLQPLLLARYPGASPAELKTAHGYAYGGSIIQDLGYYPHGSKRFSDMTHYVRTGDFVLALIAEARDLNDYAFALGALSHYASDIEVHRSATNPGEAILYPKLKRKFGPVITYEEDPSAHLKTEFGFDVLEVARGDFAPEEYHGFIGFYVAESLLARAFQDTYGLRLSDFFPKFDKTIGSYRRAVSRTIPEATRIAWAEKEKDIQNARPGMTREKFVYLMSRSSYERDWGKQYDGPTTGDRVLAFTLRLLPPLGPLRALRFKMPTPDVEKLFMQSFERCANHYSTELEQVTRDSLRLENQNYDLGKVALPAAYALGDDAYAGWLNDLARTNYETVTPDIRSEFLRYYQHLDAPFDTKKNGKAWVRLLTQLQGLKVQQQASLH